MCRVTWVHTHTHTIALTHSCSHTHSPLPHFHGHLFPCCPPPSPGLASGFPGALFMYEAAHCRPSGTSLLLLQAGTLRILVARVSSSGGVNHAIKKWKPIIGEATTLGDSHIFGSLFPVGTFLKLFCVKPFGLGYVSRMVYWIKLIHVTYNNMMFYFQCFSPLRHNQCWEK